MPPDKVVYGDDVLLLMYWTQESPRIGITVTSPLACEESCHLGLPRQRKRHESHHSGSTSKVADRLAHAGY